jgi:DNA replication protein
VSRGTLIHLALESDNVTEDIYFLNTESDRQAVAKIQSGELKLSGLKVKAPAPVPAEEPPDIFTLYEQNIGMLTPMIADELRDAEKNYPPDWIRDAVKEAVLHNKRNIRYITKILENWSVEGRSDGTYQRDSQKTGPDRYFKGKYGHMVRH